MESFIQVPRGAAAAAAGANLTHGPLEGWWGTAAKASRPSLFLT